MRLTLVITHVLLAVGSAGVFVLIVTLSQFTLESTGHAEPGTLSMIAPFTLLFAPQTVAAVAALARRPFIDDRPRLRRAVPALSPLFGYAAPLAIIHGTHLS